MKNIEFIPTFGRISKKIKRYRRKHLHDLKQIQKNKVVKIEE